MDAIEGVDGIAVLLTHEQAKDLHAAAYAARAVSAAPIDSPLYELAEKLGALRLLNV